MLVANSFVGRPETPADCQPLLAVWAARRLMDRVLFEFCDYVHNGEMLCSLARQGAAEWQVTVHVQRLVSHPGKREDMYEYVRMAHLVGGQHAPRHGKPMHLRSGAGKRRARP